VNAGLNPVHKLSSHGKFWQGRAAFMKPHPLTVLAVLSLSLTPFFSSCASPRPDLVLEPVGPPPPAVTPSADQGALLVYSAFETGVPGTQLPEGIRLHTAYELRSGNGALLRIVPNQTGYQGEDPLRLSLPAGNYLILARANGYGIVRVPVVIAAGQVTTVHLEGGAPRSKPGASDSVDNAVRLPDGTTVGWKATVAK